jgi:hypothetical protein
MAVSHTGERRSPLVTSQPQTRRKKKGVAVKRSSDRILTTHTGSLHRPRDLEHLLRVGQGAEIATKKLWRRAKERRRAWTKA